MSIGAIAEKMIYIAMEIHCEYLQIADAKKCGDISAEI